MRTTHREAGRAAQTVLVVLLLGQVALVRPARAAASRTASLGLSRQAGAEACVGSRELAEQVEKLLSRKVFVSASDAEVAIDARFEKLPDAGFRAVLGISDASGKPLGERELEDTSADCRKLDAPTALAIALMIDPDALLLSKPDPSAEQPPPKPPEHVALPVPVTKPPEKPPHPPLPPAEPELFADVFGGFSLGFGVLPQISPGAVVGASLEPRILFPFEATLRFDAPTTEAVRDAEVQFYAVWGGAYACPLSHRGELGQIRGCGGISGGFLAVEPSGFDQQDPDRSSLSGQIGATLRGRADLRVVGPLGIGLATEVTVPFWRDEFVYGRGDGRQSTLFQQSPMVAHLDAFGFLAFP